MKEVRTCSTVVGFAFIADFSDPKSITTVMRKCIREGEQYIQKSGWCTNVASHKIPLTSYKQRSSLRAHFKQLFNQFNSTM